MTTKAKQPKALPKSDEQAKLEKNKARTNLSSSINAAAVIEAYSKGVFGEQQGGLMEVYEELSNSISKVWDGDMRKCEAMLFAQASALQSIFTNLSRRSIGQDYLKQMDTYLRLALKAQAQAVRTIEALGELKNPRSIAFVKQANIANNQQVNNGQVSQAENSGNQQSKLSGETYELLPDSRASGIEGATYTPVATLETVDRAKDSRGQSQGVSELI